MWAILGGSGFENFSDFEVLEELNESTPFGMTSTGLKRVKVAGQEALFLSRHGRHHEKLPSEINFLANVFALKSYGAKAILSLSAVGSLRKELAPGDLVVPTQYIDRTKSIRAHTFCGDGVVGHMSLAEPVCRQMAKRLSGLFNQFNWASHAEKTYVCIEGPNFSTIAESHYYRFIGADIIGMTNYPEYALAREAGLSYLPCSFVTDYDCWDTSRPHVTLQEVLHVMSENKKKAFNLIQVVLSQTEPLYSGCECSDQGLKTGLMTPFELVPEDKKQWMEVLLR